MRAYDNIASPPLSFVRSGGVNLSYGSLRGFGFDGYGWSSISVAFTSVTSATAYDLHLNASGIGSSHGPNARWVGFPIRCLAYWWNIVVFRILWYNVIVALWRSGDAAVCKTAYTGSIPVGASMVLVTIFVGEA